MKKILLGIVAFMTAVVLAACGAKDESTEKEKNEPKIEREDGGQVEKDEEPDSGHDDMNHSGSGEVPEGLQKAENPTYPEGGKAIIKANHMPGMDGAEATVSGAFDTTVYTVTYTPKGGGDPVKNHKWVIHEEIEDAGNKPYKSGDEVVLDADHMKGMDEAKAVIDSAEQTTVYMVDYTDKKTGDKVTNHKWVTEDELSPTE